MFQTFFFSRNLFFCSYGLPEQKALLDKLQQQEKQKLSIFKTKVGFNIKKLKVSYEYILPFKLYL